MNFLLSEIAYSGNELRRYNKKKKILFQLYNKKALSVSEISKSLDISLTTTLSLLNEMTEEKLVEFRGEGKSRGGRKPALFGLARKSVFVIACELGHYTGRVAIYDSHNQLVASVVEFDTNINDDELVNKIFQKTKKLIRHNKIDEDLIFGVGLTMPGLVNEELGVNFTIKKEKFQNVKERLEEKFGKQVYVNNDARMQAFGEYVFGAAKGYKNAIIVNWSWGIGLGMILNGKLYNGASGFAGELSHIKVKDDGELCVCGKKGCLETIASTKTLIDKAVEGITQGKITQLTQIYNNHKFEIKPQQIIQAAKSGDEFSISLLHDIGLALGKGLSVTIQLLNPDIIVIGGPMSQANQYILIPIQQSLNKYCLEQILKNTRIVISKDWRQAGLLGVSAIMFHRVFSDN
jgi:N-acetylglucosamine repressor